MKPTPSVSAASFEYMNQYADLSESDATIENYGQFGCQIRLYIWQSKK